MGTKKRRLVGALRVVVVFAAVLAASRLAMSPVAVKVVSRQLAARLAARASLADVGFSLHRGYLAISGLDIGQPDG